MTINKNDTRCVWLANKVGLNAEKFKSRYAYASSEYGYYNQISIRGVGYRVWKYKDRLCFDLGFTHYVSITIPEMVVVTPKKIQLFLFSRNKEKLNYFCQQIKNIKIPDAYKGKGVRFSSETLVLKTGKVKS